MLPGIRRQVPTVMHSSGWRENLTVLSSTPRDGMRDADG